MLALLSSLMQTLYNRPLPGAKARRLKRISAILAIGLFWILCILLATNLLNAQDNSQMPSEIPRIEPSRPGATEGSSVVQAGTLQLESGIDVGIETDSKCSQRKIAYPVGLLRYGVFNVFEIRIVAQMLHTRVTEPLTRDRIYRLNALEQFALGGKFALCAEKGLRPAMSFDYHLFLPVGHSAYHPANAHSAFRLAFSSTLNPKLCLGYNLGYNDSGSEQPGDFAYTCTLGWEVSSRHSVNFEFFGFVPERAAPACHSYQSSWACFITPYLKVDVGGGFRYSAPAFRQFFGYAGFACRLVR